MKKLLYISLLTIAALPLLAQAVPTVGLLTAQGGGRGQGRGMRGMGGGFGSPTFLLRREDVRKDLKLASDQKTKLDDMQQGMQDKFRSAFQDAGQDADKRAAAMKTIQDDMEKQVKGILTADQWKRLVEINIQLGGSMAMMDPGVQKSLDLTSEQIAKINTLQKQQTDANQQLRDKVQSGEIDRQAVGDMMKKNTDILKTQLDKILTESQRAKLKTMGGAEFKADPPASD